MKLGYYYHVDFYVSADGFYLPDHQGYFINELTKNCNNLVVFGFTTLSKQKDQNYLLPKDSVRFINLGRRRSFPIVLLFGWLILRKWKQEIRSCNKVLVRAPSPLAPYFYFLNNSNKSRINFLFVGDYLIGIKYQTNFFLKQKLINVFTVLYEVIQNYAVRGNVCFVNSPILALKYSKIASKVELVRTTNILESDFTPQPNLQNDSVVRIVFTGRLESSKGVFDLIKVFLLFRETRKDIELHLVGWVSHEFEMSEYSSKLFLEENSIFVYGYKSAEDLKVILQQSDVFVLPSYNEGFPRSILEAMCNYLPVVSTNVGAIPFFLEDGVHCILVEPGDISALYKAIEVVIYGENINIMVDTAYLQVRELTLEKQTRIIVDKLISYE
jgi:glycosyltransferase involved in cell wall biosynthesis